jgi:hypothetical protein
MAAKVHQSGNAFMRTDIHPLFLIAPALATPPYDVSSDGGRFIVNTILPEPPTPVTLLLNWPDAVKK